MLDVIIVEDGLDCLLDLGRRHTLVVFSCALRHVQVELKDIIKLVARVEVAESLCDSGVLGSRPLESNSRLRSRFARAYVLEGGRVANHPIIVLFIPLCNLLVLAVVFRRDHVLDDKVLQFELVCQFIDSIVHVISLAIEVVVDLLQFSSARLILVAELLKFRMLEV